VLRVLCRSLPLTLLFGAALWAGPITRGEEPSVPATVTSSLATADDHIRQFACDGDPATAFISSTNPKANDHFTLEFDAPVTVRSIKVTTGLSEGRDVLESGTLEASADGRTFERLADFVAGAAEDRFDERAIKAVRIAVTADLPHPLVIRELAVEGPALAATFPYPVEFVVDVTDAPEMKQWADDTARACERGYRLINEELKSDGYKPPHLVTMTLKNDYDGVAYAGGNHIVGSVRYFKEHPDDVGAMLHETAHVVQNYHGRHNPGWLVEGVADYVRFFKFEPQNLGRIDARRAHYDRSYRVSAAFLAFLVEKYDAQIVCKLNRLMRAGEYPGDAFFSELTGKTLDELDGEWRATLK
jgi:hypothetical protein